MEKFTTVIKNNSYINKLAKSKKDIHSFGNLVSIPLTQSQNIILGYTNFIDKYSFRVEYCRQKIPKEN